MKNSNLIIFYDSSIFQLNIAGAQSHMMKGGAGYLDRIQFLINNATSYPIPSRGFAAPNYCTENDECDLKICKKETDKSFSRCVADECSLDHHCDTGRCESGMCIPMLGSCMECDEDSDCVSDKCIGNRCANLKGKMDDACFCRLNSDCESGRCEGVFTRVCEAKRPNGGHCNESSDCLSDYCNIFHTCVTGFFKNNLLNDICEISLIVLIVVGCIYLIKWMIRYWEKRFYEPIKDVEIVV